MEEAELREKEKEKQRESEKEKLCCFFLRSARGATGSPSSHRTKHLPILPVFSHTHSISVPLPLSAPSAAHSVCSVRSDCCSSPPMRTPVESLGASEAAPQCRCCSTLLTEKKMMTRRRKMMKLLNYSSMKMKEWLFVK